jgi:hypothetical protein
VAAVITCKNISMNHTFLPSTACVSACYNLPTTRIPGYPQDTEETGVILHYPRPGNSWSAIAPGWTGAPTGALSRRLARALGWPRASECTASATRRSG